MALFGSLNDIDTFKLISREVVNDVISQQIGYYKPVLTFTKSNIYGEALNKSYIGPVLLNCLIDRGDWEAPTDEFGVDTTRDVKFRILRDDLIDANIVPEVGDIVMYNEVYYEAHNVNSNQLILGKDDRYAYSPGLENFGNNYSTILVCHLTRSSKLNITQAIPNA